MHESMPLIGLLLDTLITFFVIISPPNIEIMLGRFKESVKTLPGRHSRYIVIDVTLSGTK